MNVVLVEPEIPPNTGNVARLCAATRTRLHLIEPFGFKLDNKQLKRAGMDYWQHVEWQRWAGWREFVQSVPAVRSCISQTLVCGIQWRKELCGSTLPMG
jgi:tRNA (cytidine/uridine-2'-O-)-methyltransferase